MALWTKTRMKGDKCLQSNYFMSQDSKSNFELSSGSFHFASEKGIKTKTTMSIVVETVFGLP